MASVQFKKMNWFQKRPLHEVMASWRDKRRAALNDYLDVSSAMASKMANAQINLAVGMANLAGQASLNRVQDELEAVVSGSSVNKLI